MPKYSLLLLCTLVYLPLGVVAQEGNKAANSYATLIIKTNQWLNKTTRSTAKPTLTLDVFATDEASPEIPQRSPQQTFEGAKSKYFVSSRGVIAHSEEGHSHTIPANTTVYLASYFEKQPAGLSSTIYYCNRLEILKPEPGKTYILATNFVLLGMFSAECTAKIMSPEEYVKQLSINAEVTPVANMTRKELSLRFASAQTALLTGTVISRRGDYQPVYLDAAVDRTLQVAASTDVAENRMAAWLAKIVTESGSEQHIVAMYKISQAALQSNKAFGKKILSYLPKQLPIGEGYTPKPIVAPSGFSLPQLAVIAAQENLKSNEKAELEGAAREIIANPSAFSPGDFDQALSKLKQFAQSADEEEIAAAIWMARVLAVSSNKKYVPSLTELSQLPLHKKLAKDVSLALNTLSK